ncbi:type II secretion system minor pseudopilin GspJ [Thalassotalea agarivorans]|uniref:Type II secretion system protein J n=1 Tax=Thalassotalea agarivorans TaxID=349064 RepID=A0A1I0E4E6_THASX|nr:type II secretion system minor pseudopilin GspJ [Thalassotalea agarivorans]SET39862.1 general secretion pathway protein J [Thalassotalea agarivorans]
MRHNKGFTILELIIAVAIFTLIGFAGNSMFIAVSKTNETAELRTKRLDEVQRAFMIIERDFIQIALRKIRPTGEESLDGFIHTDDNVFDSASTAIAFVRHGWNNPGYLIPRSDLQTVSYRLEEDVLQRLHTNFVDPSLGETPKIRNLLTGVESLEFEFFVKDKWQDELEQGTLPKAIAITVTTEDFGEIRRQFLVSGGVKVEEDSES